MFEAAFPRTILLLVPSVIGAFLCLALIAALARKPSWMMLFFTCFYAISVAHLAAGLLSPRLLQAVPTLGARVLWDAGLAASRLRLAFLVLFTHAVHRLRGTPALTGVMLGLVAAAAICPFLFYSLIPNLIEITVVLYSFAYCLAILLMRGRLGISQRRQGLLRAFLACSGFFLAGMLLDLLSALPQAGLVIPLLDFDFTPLYIVSIGGVMTYWAVRDLLPSAPPAPPAHPARPATGRETAAFDASRLPVSRREREVVELILRGETNAAVADRLFISESTVKKHVNSIFRKLGITSRWELLKLTRGDSPEGGGA
jgi:DNA-binding CsgD family transcriptional regulator